MRTFVEALIRGILYVAYVLITYHYVVQDPEMGYLFGLLMILVCYLDLVSEEQKHEINKLNSLINEMVRTL